LIVKHKASRNEHKDYFGKHRALDYRTGTREGGGEIYHDFDFSLKLV